MGYIPPQEVLWPEGIVRETFAVMYQMYITEPNRLRQWIEEKVRDGKEMAFNNYLFMKGIVFSGKEY